MMSKEMIFCRNHICWVLVVTYFKKQKNCGDEWWEPGVWRSQRDLPCYPLLPFVHGVGLGEVCPAHSVFSLSLLDRDPRNVCNAWKKKSSLFLRRYYWCTFMSSATKCKWMCWECLWNHVLLFCVPCHVDGLWSWLAAFFRQPPGQGPVWCFLLMTLRIRGLEASQQTCNILLACNGSVYTYSEITFVVKSLWAVVLVSITFHKPIICSP